MKMEWYKDIIIKTAMMGININDSEFPWTDYILSGEKTIETRNSPSLSPYIGQRVGIVRTGKGKATLVGYVTIGEPIIYNTKEQFDGDANKHLVGSDDSFTIKYGYPMIDVEPTEHREIDSKGIVSRQI